MKRSIDTTPELLRKNSPLLPAARGGCTREGAAAGRSFCFKNVADDGEMTLFIYGEVSDGGSGDESVITSKEVVQQLAWADEQADIKRILIRLNSIGGEVYAGFAIFQSIRAMKKPVTVQVDGLAASIAGIIAMAAPRVEMGRYARLMIHSVSGGGYGTKADLRKLIAEIESLEHSIAEILSERMGKSEAEVLVQYFDGSDHWFTAEEALSVGLCDMIYDAAPAVGAGATNDELYNLYTNRLLREWPQNRKTMTIEQLQQRHARFADCATVEDVAERAAEIASEKDALEAEKTALENENAALTQENAQLKEDAAAQRNAQIEQTVEAAVADGRIDASQKTLYTDLLKADFKNTSKVLETLPRKLRVEDYLKRGAPQNEMGAWNRKMAEIRDRKK